MKPALNKHELQFDYFSDNYQQFEHDFYCLATTATPLVFLEDDLLRSMSTGQRNYFRLHPTIVTTTFTFASPPIPNPH